MKAICKSGTARGLSAGALFMLASAASLPAQDAPQFQTVQSNTEVHSPNLAPKPGEYLQLQKAAPEDVVIRVTSVSTQAAASENGAAGALLVTARAVVTDVVRSNTKLTVGSAIYILYGYVPSTSAMPAPPPPPVLIKNTVYRAYLGGGPGDQPYKPAAGAQSFLDPSTPDPTVEAAPAAASTPNGAIADPSLLPTPDYPNLPGAIRVRGDAIDQFVKLSQSEGKWVVSVAEADPLPLQTLGNIKPVLLVYYGASLRAPVTQPSILIYQAGTQPAEPPAKGTVTVERALVLSSTHRALGDAVWALRVENNRQPLPLPLWHWFANKVEIEDPDTHKVQTILFSGNPAPAPAADPGK